MSYICTLCNYSTGDAANFIRHKKTKKHLSYTVKKSYMLTKNTSNITIDVDKLQNMIPTNTNIKEKKFTCKDCEFETKHRSSYYRHLKTCSNQKIHNNNNNDIDLKIKLIISEKEKELEKEKVEIYKQMHEEKTELLNNFMTNSNILLNKANDNTKVTAEAMKSVSMSAIKYANDKFQNTPALLPLENFNINDLDFDKVENKAQLVEILIYNAKQKSLDKLLGDHIVKEYKKDNPEEQSFHTTDCSRLNYIVRKLIENALSWSIDKNGIQVCKDIVKPLIKKCINALLEHQKILLQNMGIGNYTKQKDVELIIDVIMSIDSGSLEVDINKYIAPYFNLTKKEN
jgi:hypothetical protein